MRATWLSRSQSPPISRGSPRYVVYGTWESKDAWERAHQTTEQFKSLFKSLPVERHTLSRTSFFEPAYEFAGTAARDSRA